MSEQPSPEEVDEAEIASMLRSYEGPPLARSVPAARPAWRRLRPAAVALAVLALAAGASVAVYLVERGPGRGAAIGTPCSFAANGTTYFPSGVASRDVATDGTGDLFSATCNGRPTQLRMERIRGVAASLALANTADGGVVFVARRSCASEKTASALLTCLKA
ncbi:MAG: hypothetical protein ABR521_03940 [Gaiellaceae bacterium]